MTLFHPRVINKKLSNVAPVPAQEAKILSDWSENLDKGIYNIETQSDGEFIQQILINVLGYLGSTTGDEWTVAKNQPAGSGNVDAALGFFTPDNKTILAPFELKGAQTKDLDAIMPGRNKSPVQQAWEYAIDIKGAKWVLVSNYREIRLYAVGFGRKNYETFDIKKLTDPFQYAKFMLLLSPENLLSDRTHSLLAESEKVDKQITNELYSDYKNLRKSLINTIIKNNKKISSLKSIELAQTILDRILFIAFAEDKGLLPENTLEKAFETQNEYNPQPVWENFKGLFRAINKGSSKLNIPAYNGGLFAENEEIDNLILTPLLCEKFKNIGKYDFESDVGVNILGHIFEQSISDIEELKAKTSGETTANNSATKRKKDGIFYTPPYVTRFIVEQSIGGWLAKQKEKIGFHKLPELSEQDYESIQVVQKGRGKNKTTSIKTNKNIKKHILAWEAYKEILSTIKILDPACGSGAFLNEIFDFLKNEGDIVNGQLVNLKGEQTGLFRWDTHILSNNLFGVDLNGESVEITKLSLWLKTANKSEKLTYLEDNIKVGNSLFSDPEIAGVNAFNWDEEFSEIMSSGGFDIVVGNPPYIPMELIPEKQKQSFKEDYSCLERKYDTSIVFILKCLNLLNDEGTLSFISSTTWQTGKNYKLFRKQLFEEFYLNSVVNLPFDVFEDAYVDTCIYSIGKKLGKSKNYKIYSYNKKDRISHLEGLQFEEVPFELSEKHSDYSIILNPRAYAVKQRIENIKGVEVLGDISKSTQGLAKSRFDLKDAEYPKSHPFLFDAEINRYKLNLKEVKFTDFSEKESLEQFYLGEPKILIRRLISRQDRVLCSYTDKNFAFSKDTNPFILNEKKKTLYVLACLNSKLMSYMYVNLSSIATKDDFRQTTLGELRDLPIVFPKRKVQQRVSDLVSEILESEAKLFSKKDDLIRLTLADFGIAKANNKLSDWPKLDFSQFLDEIKKLIKPQSLSLTKKSEWLKHFESERKVALNLINKINAAELKIDQEIYDVFEVTKEEVKLINSYFNSI